MTARYLDFNYPVHSEAIFILSINYYCSQKEISAGKFV